MSDATVTHIKRRVFLARFGNFACHTHLARTPRCMQKRRPWNWSPQDLPELQPRFVSQDSQLIAASWKHLPGPGVSTRAPLGLAVEAETSVAELLHLL